MLGPFKPVPNHVSSISSMPHNVVFKSRDAEGSRSVQFTNQARVPFLSCFKPNRKESGRTVVLQPKPQVLSLEQDMPCSLVFRCKRIDL